MQRQTRRILAIVLLAVGLVGLVLVLRAALRGPVAGGPPVPGGPPVASQPKGPPAADWPQWRYDAGRGAATPGELPDRLHLQWVRQLPAPRPAWPPSQPWLRFDLSYSPVAAQGMLFVPSMVSDRVTAYDTKTGQEKWRFYADGPVRLAPIAHQGKVYFGCDDGYLYCVDAGDGTLLWRFRGGPCERKVLGNERLISTWPVRGGPVLFDNKVYFTAGIWPFMGIFVQAVDAQTGRVVWTNSGGGSTYTTQPHDSPAFSGFAPRGHLAATPRGLIVPGGRTQPGCYDLQTGELRYFNFGPQGGGSSQVSARDQWFFVAGSMVRIADGVELLHTPATVHEDQTLYSVQGNQVVANGLQLSEREVEKRDRKGKMVKSTVWELAELWRLPLAGAPGRLFLKAGSRLVTGGPGVVALIEADPSLGAAKVVWKGSFEGEPWTMLAADQRLFVVTTAGSIYCFGEEETAVKTYGPAASEQAGPPQDDADGTAAAGLAKAIIKDSQMSGGYCVMFGLDEPLASALVEASDLQLIVIDPDAGKVGEFRRRMDDAGLYGTRIAAHVGQLGEFPLPPYLASLVVAGEIEAAAGDQAGPRLAAVFRTLRPYSGRAYLRIAADRLRPLVEQAKLAGARVQPAQGPWSLLIREGPLPGSADWTHNYADASATVVSRDKLVKLPLGLLWFGGPEHEGVLPRHGHGPSPQVAAGRLFIEGRNMLRATDIYTGRLLWTREFQDLGKFYDITDHQPGANEIGSNYVSLADCVYLVYGSAILELDPATGKLRREFKLPSSPDDPNPSWGYIAVEGDLLVATSQPVAVELSKGKQGDQKEKKESEESKAEAGYRPLVGAHESWQYLAGDDPQGEWTAPDFAARGWKTGQAGFGYGDNDDRTVLGDMQNKYTRVYIRKTFEGKSAAGATEAILEINYDDAFIAYLNGREICRVGVERGSGKDAAGIADHEAQGSEQFRIRDFGSLLRPGRNVLAIEGHNTRLGSSDFSLDPMLLIGGDGETPADESALKAVSERIGKMLTPARYASASRRLVVLDRRSGDQVWDRLATYGFRHNNIVVGAGKVFCIDGISKAKLDALRRRGLEAADYRPRLLALDLRTGREVWSTEKDVFGTFLNYSAEHDVLLQSGSAARDRPIDESAAGMVAYRGRDGEVLWKDLSRKFNGPCMLYHSTIICQGPAYSLLTGKRRTRKHPLTGEPLAWEFTRNYGCNTAIGGEHLLLFRSAAAGFYDLRNQGGTGNFGGFRSGCTSNLIAAGGLLNAPEYTRTCTCRYQNQTSLALVYDPDVEVWTFNAFAWDGQPVRRVGINFGAPGDRMAEDGTLWLDFPSTGGPSPDIPVQVEPQQVQYFRYHSSRIQADPGSGELAWVAASGVRGVSSVTITLAKDTRPRNYTVRLHFAEVEDVQPGQRVFSVALQGKEVLKDFDVVQEAGGTTGAGANRAVVREFQGIEVSGSLRVSLSPRGGSGAPGPVLCGIQIVAEGW